MIAGLSPTLQALLATLFTWLVTAMGAALVFLVPRSLAERSQRKLLDAALGFAAGVMLAASYWSLLAPALEFAEQSGVYGAHSYAPVTVGLLLGAAFVYGADQLIPHEAGDAVAVLSQTRTRADGRSKKQDDETEMSGGYGGPFASQAPPLTRAASMSRKRNTSSTRLDEAADEMEAHRMPERQVSASGKKLKSSPPPMLAPGGSKKKGTRSSPRRQSGAFDMGTVAELAEEEQQQESPRENNSAASAAAASAAHEKAQSWHRILLLVVAIVIHNFPEGLAVGVGFGALSSVQPPDPLAHAVLSAAADAAGNATVLAEAEMARAAQYDSMFAEARTLAFGIGLQNFPEGLAVSLPLLRVGFSRTEAFWYGQLSGMVEPVGGLLGAALIGLMQPLLPYALAFAAGAMIFVVVEDLIPETRSPGGFPTLASAGVMVGFCVMMALDVGLG